MHHLPTPGPANDNTQPSTERDHDAMLRIALMLAYKPARMPPTWEEFRKLVKVGETVLFVTIDDKPMHFVALPSGPVADEYSAIVLQPMLTSMMMAAPEFWSGGKVAIEAWDCLR